MSCWLADINRYRDANSDASGRSEDAIEIIHVLDMSNLRRNARIVLILVAAFYIAASSQIVH